MASKHNNNAKLRESIELHHIDDDIVNSVSLSGEERASAHAERSEDDGVTWSARSWEGSRRRRPKRPGRTRVSSELHDFVYFKSKMYVQWLSEKGARKAKKLMMEKRLLAGDLTLHIDTLVLVP